MPPQPPSTDRMLAQKIWEDTKAQAIGMAKIQGPAANQEQYTADDELLMWNKQADDWTVEKEFALHGLNPDMTPMLDPRTGQPVKPKSPREIGLLKYPHRDKLMKSGERVLSPMAQFEYAAKMAKKSDPNWTPLPTPEAPPLPESLGQDTAPTLYGEEV